MPLREDILNPIPGEIRAAQDLRYDPVYDKIKEARREDDDLNQGAWQHERKVADLSCRHQARPGSHRHTNQRPAIGGLA